MFFKQFTLENQDPPGPDGGFWGLGNIARYQKDSLKFLAELAGRYGDLVYFQMGPNYIYLLNHPELVHQVFLKGWQSFNKPDFLKASNRGHWGDGLTTLEAARWQTRRHLLQPAFYHHQITTCASAIVDCTQEMLNSWQSGQIINVDKSMLLLTARIAARVLFDAELEGHGSAAANRTRTGLIPVEEALGEHFTATQSQDGSTASYMIRRRAGPDMKTTRRIITDRFNSRVDRGDILSFLLNATYEDGSRMSLAEVTDELLQMFFAGHHSIPMALLWLWYLLSQNPSVEQKVQAELDLTLGGRRPEADDLPHLAYGEMVIKETMRFCLPTPLLIREVVEDFQLDGYSLKKGAFIWISPYLLHFDPRNFDQPGRFWPERFSKKRTKSISKYAYLPFGAGPRICIGNTLSMLQIRLILATIAQAYCLTLAPGQTGQLKPFLPIHPDNQATSMQVVARPGASC